MYIINSYLSNRVASAMTQVEESGQWKKNEKLNIKYIVKKHIVQIYNMKDRDCIYTPWIIIEREKEKKLIKIEKELYSR